MERYRNLADPFGTINYYLLFFDIILYSKFNWNLLIEADLPPQLKGIAETQPSQCEKLGETHKVSANRISAGSSITPSIPLISITWSVELIHQVGTRWETFRPLISIESNKVGGVENDRLDGTTWGEVICYLTMIRSGLRRSIGGRACGLMKMRIQKNDVISDI